MIDGASRLAVSPLAHRELTSVFLPPLFILARSYALPLRCYRCAVSSPSAAAATGPNPRHCATMTTAMTPTTTTTTTRRSRRSLPRTATKALLLGADSFALVLLQKRGQHYRYTPHRSLLAAKRDFSMQNYITLAPASIGEKSYWKSSQKSNLKSRYASSITDFFMLSDF